MIPSQAGYRIPTWSETRSSYQRMLDYGTNLTVNPQGALDVVPLQNIPTITTVPYSPYFPYQKVVPVNELLRELGSKDPNESLLLTLTKKMDELAVNLAKDKEQTAKPSNMHPNVWCSNYTTPGPLVTKCPSPLQMTVQYTFLRRQAYYHQLLALMEATTNQLPPIDPINFVGCHSI